MEEDGVHTLAGVISHGLSEISEVKVSVKKFIIDHCQQVKMIIPRTYLTCTPASLPSSPGSTLRFFPTGGSPPVTILSLLCLSKVNTNTLAMCSDSFSQDFSNSKVKILQEVLDS